MGDKDTQVAVSKIAIINPYLQGGHLEIAESESSLRFIEAGKNLGIDIRVFAHSDEVEAFDPDFVVGITYQEGKLSKYPSYVSLNIAPSLIKDVPKFVRNILSYDGFMTVSPVVSDWLHQLCGEHHKKAHIAHSAFSVPKTEFTPCDFSNAVAMYMGTNWDGMRHRNLFKLLESGEYLKCYGPKKSWATYSETLYAGEMPFDGNSAFAAYRKHGIGLCINHPDFDNEGIASSRVFEIAAAGALPVCAENSLTRKIYGDSVLYLDKHESTEDLARQITEKVQWVRAHPDLAQDMAREAHSRFNQHASMEIYIQNLVAVHQKAMHENKYLKSEALEQDRVTYLVAAANIDESVATLLNDLKNQTYNNLDVVLITDNQNDLAKFQTEMSDKPDINIIPVKYEGQATNLMLKKHLTAMRTQWIGILSPGVRIFPNHTAVIMKNYHDYHANRATPVSVLRALYLEYSGTTILQDYMAEQHWVASDNKIRLGLKDVTSGNTLGRQLINVRLLGTEFFKHLNLMSLLNENYTSEFEKVGEVVEIHEVTTSHDLDKRQVQQTEADLRREVMALRDANAQQAALINEIYSSKSWVYTAPLRKFITFVRDLKNNIFAPPATTGD